MSISTSLRLSSYKVVVREWQIECVSILALAIRLHELLFFALPTAITLSQLTTAGTTWRVKLIILVASFAYPGIMGGSIAFCGVTRRWQMACTICVSLPSFRDDIRRRHRAPVADFISASSVLILHNNDAKYWR